jgi:nicotinamide-nucleotide amidase
VGVRCEIIGVGTELLLGQIVNTNAAWIGQRLADVGWDCLRHTAVGDNEGRIAGTIREALGRADAVILTGGLGPTQDDVTREALAAVAGVGLVRQPELEQWLRDRFARMGVRRMAEMNLRQADVPEAPAPSTTPAGPPRADPRARRQGRSTPCPGSPREMEGMLEQVVLPDLAARAGEGPGDRLRGPADRGVGESRLAERLTPLWEEAGAGEVTLAYLASPGEVRVRLTAVGPDPRAGPGRDRPGRGQDPRRARRDRLRHRRREPWRRSSAASCASAAAPWPRPSPHRRLLGGRITGIGGSSDYYLGGVVAYATDAKAAQLGVDPALLETDGPVSEPVAAAMAAGVRSTFGADYGLAVTGVAGPTGAVRPPRRHPLPRRRRYRRHRHQHVDRPGDRTQVRLWTCAVALDLLRRRLEGRA